MSSRGWTVHYFRDEDGSSPVEEFVAELTEAEQGRLLKRLEYLVINGPHQVRSDIATQVRGSDGLWRLQMAKSQNNPRFLFCTRPGFRIVLLHGFKEKTRKDYAKAIPIAKRRMQTLISDEEKD